VPWDISSFKSSVDYKRRTEGNCVCGYCLKPVSFVSEAKSRTTKEPLRSRHFRHLNPGDKDFCPYETGESLEHVTVKKNWFLNVLDANTEYLKIPDFSVKTEKTVKTDGRKASRRYDIGLFNGEKFFAALETEASVKAEYASQIAERTLDYNCLGAAVDWSFTSNTVVDVAEISLLYTGAYRRTSIFYKQVKQVNPDNGAVYEMEDRAAIERTETLIYYKDSMESVLIDVEQEAIRVEQLIKFAEKAKVDPEKYYEQRKLLLIPNSPSAEEQHVSNETQEIPLSKLIKLQPEILGAVRQKIRIGTDFGLMTDIDIKRGVITFTLFGTKYSREAPIDVVVVCDPKINCLHISPKEELTPEKVHEYRTAVAEAKQSIDALGTEYTESQLKSSVSAVVIVDEQVKRLANQLDICSNIKEAKAVFATIKDPAERLRLSLALPNYIKDKLARLSFVCMENVA
jgi:hypothetical protein